MEFLTDSEHERLMEILRAHPLLGGEEKRRKVLIACGLKNLIEMIELDKKDEFFIDLFNLLIYDPEDRLSGGRSFVAFLSRLIEVSRLPNSEDVEHLKIVRDKCRSWCESHKVQTGLPLPRHQAFKEHYNRLREQPVHTFKQAPSSGRVNYQAKIVTAYDLEDLILELKKRVIFGQITAFIVTVSDYHILKTYIIKRMYQEFKEGKERRIDPIDISLSLADLTDPSGLESLLEKRFKISERCRKINESQHKHPEAHIFLTVRNYGISHELICGALSQFRQTIESKFSAYLEANNLCFAFILANILSPNNDPWEIDKFVTLQLPGIVPDRLEKWIRGQLTELKVDKEDIDDFVQQVDVSRAEFIQTFHSLDNAADELQGKYDARYNSKQHMNRGRYRR
jgi:hypothetical protein